MPTAEAVAAYTKISYNVMDGVAALNRLLPPASEPLRVPDIRFRRNIGEHAGQRYTIEGEPLASDEYDTYLQRMLPSDADYRLLDELARSDDWVEQKNVPAPRAAHG